MRLDLALKYSRLIKRRTIAKEYCERGLVLVNEKIGKPSSEVKDGDLITVTMGVRVITFEITIEQEGRKIKLSYKLINQSLKDDSNAQA